jgi:hypothetical protein
MIRDSIVFIAFCWLFVGSMGQPASPVPLKAEGIENFFQLSERIYSGALPEGDAAFEALEKLGVKTVISVDGLKPNIELAHKHGMRYVHLPHGYNGIDADTQARLIKATETLSVPIFFHCHQGMHRGPTAAAIACMATEGWSTEKAEAWLKTARTGSNYVGLFKTVREFRPPSLKQLQKIPPDFPEIAPVPGLVDAMVSIDEQWDHLRAISKASYRAPKDQRDLDPPNEALILWEHFREAQRLKESSDRGETFVETLQLAETRARELEQLLRRFTTDGSPQVCSQLDKSLEALGQTCAACHNAYRDAALSRAKK